MILGEFPLDLVSYGYALLEALIIGKVILLGRMLGLGNSLATSRLAIVVIYKAFIFALFTLVFSFFEDVLRAYWNGESSMDIYADFLARDAHRPFGRLIIMFAAFVPFFSFLELTDVIGQDNMFKLFFSKKDEKDEKDTKDEKDEKDL